MKSGVCKTKLKNGLTVLFEKRKLPIITLFYASKFGSGYETARIKGIAHFLEHAVFQGTKNRTQEEIASAIEKVGGVLNAFTADQVTAFWTKIPSKHINLGFDIISDLSLNPLFDPSRIEKERKVIFEEKKLRHDMPHLYVLEKIKSLLYKAPLGLPTIGTEKSIRDIKQKDLFVYHRHNLSDTILAVVGNSTFDDVLKLAKEKFQLRPEKLKRKMEIHRINKQIIEKRGGLDQIHLVLALHMPALSHPKRYCGELISALLGEGMASPLFQEIREKRGLAYTVKSAIEQEKSYGHLLVYAGINKKSLKEVKQIIINEIKKLQNLKSRNFEEVKEQLIGNYSLLNENSHEVATQLVLNEIAGEAEEFYYYPERISKVKLEDVKKLAKIKNYSFVALVPK